MLFYANTSSASSVPAGKLDRIASDPDPEFALHVVPRHTSMLVLYYVIWDSVHLIL